MDGRNLAFERALAAEQGEPEPLDSVYSSDPEPVDRWAMRDPVDEEIDTLWRNRGRRFDATPSPHWPGLPRRR